MKKYSAFLLTSFIGLISCLGLASCGDKKTVDSAPEKFSTAQMNVSLYPEQLAMPGLNRTRQIRIYLPPSYATSTVRFPVIYMHDAQNLFDDATAYSGEWKVDETLNRLAKSHGLELIVVGIDNGSSRRMTELNPWPHPDFGPAEGKEYVDFIVRTLKPVIDQHYRTLNDSTNTAIMGSSMGGLISHYAIATHPDVFGRAGIFSPSYWAAKESIDFFADKAAAKDARLYFYMGGQEGGPMVPDIKRVYESVVASGHPADNVSLSIVEAADHNEAAWSDEFARAVEWLFRPKI